MIYSREMVSFLKNDCKFYNNHILEKYFKLCIFDNSFLIICGYILLFMRKYKKFKLYWKFLRRKEDILKKSIVLENDHSI